MVRSIENVEYNQNPIKSKDGSTKTIRWRNTTLKNEQGEIIGTLSSGQDISELELAASELKSEEQKYKNAFDKSPVALVEMEVSTLLEELETYAEKNEEALKSILFNNPGIYSKLLSKIKIININNKALDLFQVEDAKQFKAAFPSIFSKEHIINTFLGYTKKTAEIKEDIFVKNVKGKKLSLIDSKKIDYNSNHVFTSYQDLTALKQAQIDASQNAEQFYNIFESNPLGMFIYQNSPDGSLALVSSNPASDRLMKVNISQIPGRSLSDKFPNISNEILEKVANVIQTGEQLKGGQFEYTKDDSVLTFQLNAFKLSDDQGVVIFDDVTEVIEAEKNLVELNELKNKFIHVVSHQFRTPLSAIKWNIETLLGGSLGKMPVEANAFLRTTYNANNDIIKRLNDLLEVMDVEEGRVLFKPELIAVDPIWRSVEADYLDKLTIKEIDYTYHKPETELSEIFCDRSEIRVIFDRLLENAVNYTNPGGKIVTSLFQKEDMIRFEVSDNGIGIPEEEQKRIFNKFYRGSNSVRMVTNSTGIGLTIVKYYVEQHHGKIGFESKENEGTTFWVEIPTSLNPEYIKTDKLFL